MMEPLTLFSRFSQAIGAPEAALKLLLSLLLGYPLLLIHRHLLYRKSPTLQHLYFIACGVCIGVFNNGAGIFHSAVCVTVGWLLLVFMGGTFASVVISNVFQMGYLLIGYYLSATESYDIKWTMPHCVLTLRLIALTWDMYDGHKDKSELSKDQETTALFKCPSLLEVAGQTYFPASYMVGPQFPMKRYKDFVNGDLFSEPLPDTVALGLKRGCLGLFFVAVYQVASIWLQQEYLVSQDFQELSFVSKCVYVGLWGKITLYKYNSVWLITEGICILSGLSYNGKESCLAADRWDGCANIKVTRYEKATRFYHIIESFNINTNVWVGKYVYKRLKFLNNRNISALSALLFLALWHGLHSGYYACFFLEFVINVFEKDVEGLVSRYPVFARQLQSPLVKPLLLIIMKIYVLVFFGYSLGPFVLLKSYRWWAFFKSMYFIGHIFFGAWFVCRPLAVMALDAVYGKPVRPAAYDAKPAVSESKPADKKEQ